MSTGNSSWKAKEKCSYMHDIFYVFYSHKNITIDFHKTKMVSLILIYYNILLQASKDCISVFSNCHVLPNYTNYDIYRLA